MDTNQAETYLKQTICNEVFVKQGEETIVNSDGSKPNWLFDFRRVLLNPQVLHAVTDIFYKKFKDQIPFQIGGIEVASISLMAGMIMSLNQRGVSAHGFYIRKSRKKTGLLRMIEGSISADKIILVDDLLNTGKSLIRQVEVIESLGKSVYAIFTILRFHDLAYYEYFHQKGIHVVTLFSLDDFESELGTKNRISKIEAPTPMPFTVAWYFKSADPDYFHVISKSKPVLDEQKVYFGSDNGTFWSLNQDDGSVAWTFQLPFPDKRHQIFSSPLVYNNSIYFGAQDGNFYSLDCTTGRKKWMFLEADWIRSSPTVAEKYNLIYVGLQFGFWKKNGSLVALDATHGTKQWEFSIPQHVYASPSYSQKHNMVVCGASDGILYALNAKTGTLLWTFTSNAEIRGDAVFDEKNGQVIFGSADSYIYFLNIHSGALLKKVQIEGWTITTPLLHHGGIYVSSLDKTLYRIDTLTYTVTWKFNSMGRIFASPIIFNSKIYIGSNDSRLYELDSETGKETGFFQATERITNAIAINENTGRIFLPTYANEMYCLERKNN